MPGQGRFVKRFVLTLGVLVGGFGLVASGCGPEDSGEVITVYVGRSQALVEPLLNQFAEASGIGIRVRYGDGTDLVLGILEEGANTDVDVFYGQDVGALGALKEDGLLAPLPTTILDKVDPAFRSSEGLWVGISGRARVIVYNTDRVDPATLPDTILDYTDPRWNGRIGIVPRSDGFPEFVTALRVSRGETFALQWLKDLKANNPRTYPNNLAAIQAVANREIEVAFLNHYYLYRFLAEQGEGFKARNYFFDNGDLGGLFLVSGAAALKSSDNPEAARKFIEFLLSERSQQYFADHDYEYPLAGGTPNAALPNIDALRAPDIDLSDLGDLRGSLDMMRQAAILP
jgi:iron(III) transport system substrate-binding protein